MSDNRRDRKSSFQDGFVLPLKRMYLSDRFPLYIISIGVLIRLSQYLCNKSLWLDEAALSLNIINRSFSGLLGGLDYNQIAPIGFLFVQKAMTLLFGTSEYALRLFPLVSGVLSLILFYHVAKSILKREAVPIALAFFALSWSLVYFSVEVKQYSSDVMLTLLFFLVFLCAQKRGFDVGGSILLAALGCAAVWISHPVVFVMAGVGATCLFIAASKREWRRALVLISICSLWALSFALHYFLFVSREGGSGKEWIYNYWSGHFAPFPVASMADVEWYVEHLVMLFRSEFLLGMSPVAGVWLAVFLGGVVSLFIRERRVLFYLIIPFLVTLAASALDLYPFYDRLIVFLLPLVILIVSEGLFEALARSRGRSPILSVLAALVIGISVIVPTVHSENSVFKPITREEIKPVLAYISAHREPGDVIYIHYGAEYQYLYYADRYGLASMPAFSDTLIYENPYIFFFQLDEIEGNERVWVLFSHIYNQDKIDKMRKNYLDHLDAAGVRLDSFYSAAAAVFLYDLGGGE